MFNHGANAQSQLGTVAPSCQLLEQRDLRKRHETILATKADECPRPPSSLVQHINVLDTLQQQSGTLPTEIDALQRTA